LSELKSPPVAQLKLFSPGLLFCSKKLALVGDICYTNIVAFLYSTRFKVSKFLFFKKCIGGEK